MKRDDLWFPALALTLSVLAWGVLAACVATWQTVVQ